VRTLVAVLCCAAFVACGGDEASSLDDAADRLQDVRSGVLDMAIQIEAGGAGPVGFEIAGPFSLSEGRFPITDWEITRSLGDQVSFVRFISTGEQAFLEVDGIAYQVPADQLSSIGAPGAALQEGFEELDLSEWVNEPRVDSDGDAQTISGDLDAVAVVQDLVEIAGDPLDLSEEDLEALERIVRDGEIEVRLDAKGFPISVLVHAEMGSQLADDVPAQLRTLTGASVTLRLGLSEPNSEVDVSPPPDPQPLEGLTSGG
jgi:hypothetical protein